MDRHDSNPDSAVSDAEFESSTRDQAQARALRKQLQQLAGGGAGEVLQEMSKEILSGRIGLREALRVPAYAEALGERTRTFREAWEHMTPEERESQQAGARRFLDAQRQEIEEERREKQDPPASGKPARHSGRGWSAY
ncbi:hypothetical protein [Streptomyces sp. V3I7]|uniref:hypothetical protein n=1 Tax=Streptomyces sp. V3I7 TaxID=3042278 RepID=UPI0027D89CE5|nr:hypothetical protein [Streptomyces sp. V3I7]